MYKKFKILGFLILFFSLSSFSNENNECIICTEELYNRKDDVLTLACSGSDEAHIFHFKCIDGWKKKNATCPMCRTPLNENINEIELDEDEKKAKLRVYQYKLSKPTHEVLQDTSHAFCTDLIGLLKNFWCINVPRND